MLIRALLNLSKAAKWCQVFYLIFNSRFSGKGEVSSTSPKSIDKARVSKESRKGQKGGENA